jgi:DNA adenine methylase
VKAWSAFALVVVIQEPPTVTKTASPRAKPKKPPRVASPLKAPGGKHYLLEAIAAAAPKHTHFVEPFAFSAKVLFATTSPDRSEVINDSSLYVSNFWWVLQRPKLFKEFQRQVLAVPFSEPEFELPIDDGLDGRLPTDVAKLSAKPDVEAAVRFFVKTRQSYCAIGKSFAPITRNRTRNRINEQASAWLGAIAKLPEVHARLIPVVVLCSDFQPVMRQQDGPNTWFYIDPPYENCGVPVNPGLYAHGFAREDHVRLLKLSREMKGKVLISGYDNDLYNQMLKDWNKVLVPKASAMTKTKDAAAKPDRVEVLWRNY